MFVYVSVWGMVSFYSVELTEVYICPLRGGRWLLFFAVLWYAVFPQSSEVDHTYCPNHHTKMVSVYFISGIVAGVLLVLWKKGVICCKAIVNDVNIQ